MRDTDGNTMKAGDKVLVYRPGISETATVDVPDARLGLTTSMFFLRYPDGFSALHTLSKDGKPEVPADWRVVKAAS